MIRNERFIDGVCVEAQVIDLDAGIVIYEQQGVEVSRRPVTDEEREMWSPQPDARESALAKLQALGLTEAEALALIGGL